MAAVVPGLSPFFWGFAKGLRREAVRHGRGRRGLGRGRGDGGGGVVGSGGQGLGGAGFEAEDLVELVEDDFFGLFLGAGFWVGGVGRGRGEGLEALAGEFSFLVFEFEALAGEVGLAPMVEGWEGGGAVLGGGVGLGEGVEGLREGKAFDGGGEGVGVEVGVGEELLGEGGGGGGEGGEGGEGVVGLGRGGRERIF